MASPVLAQMFPYDSAGATAGSLTLDFDDITTINDGDLLLIICGDDADNSTGVEFDDDSPGGFTKKIETGDGASDCHLAVYYLHADGTETGTFTLNHSSNNDELWANLIRITGAVATGDPFSNLLESVELGAVTSFTCNSGLPDGSNDWLYMGAVAFDGGDANITWWFGNIDQVLNQTNSGTTGNDASGRVAYAEITGSASEQIVWSSNGTSDGWAGVGFSITPADLAPFPYPSIKRRRKPWKTLITR